MREPDPMGEFHAYMRTIPPGTVQDVDDLSERLCSVWHLLEGGSEQGMAAYKLRGRMESVEWTPPVLVLEIERHGGTVLGSSRAEIHRWELNLKTLTATSCSRGYSQLTPRAPTFDTNALAENVSEAILAARDDALLHWIDRRHKVRVLVGQVPELSDGPKQTIAGRRKRFHAALRGLLAAQGWQRRDGQSIYVRSTVSVDQ